MYFARICSYNTSEVQVDAHMIYEALYVRSCQARLTPSEEDRIRIVSSYTVLLLVIYLHCVTCAAKCYSSDSCIILVYSRLFPNYSDYSHVIVE